MTVEDYIRHTSLKKIMQLYGIMLEREKEYLLEEEYSALFEIDEEKTNEQLLDFEKIDFIKLLDNITDNDDLKEACVACAAECDEWAVEDLFDCMDECSFQTLLLNCYGKPLSSFSDFSINGISEEAVEEIAQIECHLLDRNYIDFQRTVCQKLNDDLLGLGNQQYRYCYQVSEKGTFDQVLLKSPDHCCSEKISAYVLNLSAPATIDELKAILQCDPPLLDMEIAISGAESSWTAPQWAKVGDIIFFACGKSSIRRIKHSKAELKRSGITLTPDEYHAISELIDKEERLYERYGGKIFAVGRICGANEWDEYNPYADYSRKQIYAEVTDVCVLSNPIEVTSCSHFLKLSETSGLTNLDDTAYRNLVSAISNISHIPVYLQEANIIPMYTLAELTEKWLLQSPNELRRFVYENQFRRCYVDFLLQALSRRKKKYSNCGIRMHDSGYSYIDRVILINKKYLPVEVKLDIAVERNINDQIRRYCHADFVVFDEINDTYVLKDELYCNYILIVDTKGIYIYNYRTNHIEEIQSLSNITSHKSIEETREKLDRILADIP